MTVRYLYPRSRAGHALLGADLVKDDAASIVHALEHALDHAVREMLR